LLLDINLNLEIKFGISLRKDVQYGRQVESPVGKVKKWRKTSDGWGEAEHHGCLPNKNE